MRDYDPVLNGEVALQFLSSFFGKVQPEYRLGFTALRRTELRKLGEAYNVDFDPDAPAEETMRRFDLEWGRGKFGTFDVASMIVHPSEKEGKLKDKIREEIMADLKAAGVIPDGKKPKPDLKVVDPEKDK